MKINSNNYINFQKKLVATSKVGDVGARQKVNIYELDKFSDRVDLDRLYMTSAWDKSYYVEEINDEFAKKFFTPLGQDSHFYIMENSQKEPICVSVLNKANRKKNQLDYLETAHSYSTYGDGTRRVRYIGETMLAFLVKMTKKEDKNFEVPDVAQREKTKAFYFDHCGFKQIGDRVAYLKKKNFKNFLSLNKSHTGSKIKISL